MDHSLGFLFLVTVSFLCRISECSFILGGRVCQICGVHLQKTLCCDHFGVAEIEGFLYLELSQVYQEHHRSSVHSSHISQSLSWQLSTALSGRASILPFGRICGCCWQAQWRLGGSLRILTINLIFALLGSSVLVNDGVARSWEVQSCFCSMALLQMSCFFLIGWSGVSSSRRVILQSSQSFGKT